MGYIGTEVPIPLGQEGLRVDDVSTTLPPTSLASANNVRFVASRIEKDNGATKYNDDALTDAVVGIYDWWPEPNVQRLIAVTADGKVWRDTGSGTFSAATPIDSTFGLPTTDFMFVPGGNEDASQDSKLFMFSYSHQLSYLDGDAGSVTTTANPATDWSVGNYPTGGFVFGDHLIAFGNPNFPHNLYISKTSDQSDFSDNDTLGVFPGEAETILKGFVYKGVAFIFKRPFGVYAISAPTADIADWTVQRVDTGFGLSSPHALMQVLDDLVAANNTGSMTSLKATDAFGDVEAGDILANAQIEDYIRQLTDPDGYAEQHVLYYPAKKLGYITYRRSGSLTNDIMLVMDVNRQNPRFSIDTRNAANCLALRKDTTNIQRPMYGTVDGYVFLMDTGTTYTLDGDPYLGEFKLQNIDFSFLDPRFAAMNKIFDFLTVIFRPQGNTTVFIDVFVDESLVQTIEFEQTSLSVLDDFELDVDEMDGNQLNETRIPISGYGKRISFRLYNNEAVGFKIEQLIVAFRTGDEGEKDG